jgi:hypothetical protein
MKRIIAIIALLLLSGFNGFSSEWATGLQAAPAGGACDRACLAGFVTQYLDAMIAHKPESLPVAANVKFTVALTYPAGLKIGSFVKADSPMAPDAYRYENGQLMTGPGCTFFRAATT